MAIDDITPDLWALYGDLLQELTFTRVEHSLAVGARVAAIAHTAPAWARADLIAAAVLHDVGYSPTNAHLNFHPLDGAAMLRDLGFSPLVLDLVATHTAAALEARERGLDLALFDPFIDPRPDVDYLRRMLTWADLNTGPDGRAVTVDQRLSEILDRYDETSVVHRHITRSHKMLRQLGSAQPHLGASDSMLNPHTLAAVHG